MDSEDRGKYLLVHHIHLDLDHERIETTRRQSHLRLLFVMGRDGAPSSSHAATLDCAETYNCPELKNKCVAFLVKNFKKAVLTDGKFHSILSPS
nr:unnamed protein product [Digitaria exilis]